MDKLKLLNISIRITFSVNSSEQTIKRIEKNSKVIKLPLDHFKGIPDELNGCSCYFSETDDKYKNREYLFAASFDSIGFVSVDNKLIKLKLVSSGRKTNKL